MGASGAGKTTVGMRLAVALGVPFYDADAFHSPEAIRKMASGEPLTDADRSPWLARLNQRLRDSSESGEGAVLACSALKAAYRESLARNLPALRFVYLSADAELLHRRLSERRDHYMKVGMLDSQLETLEEPGPEAVTVDASRPVEEIVSGIVSQL